MMPQFSLGEGTSALPIPPKYKNNYKEYMRITAISLITERGFIGITPVYDEII